MSNLRLDLGMEYDWWDEVVAERGKVRNQARPCGILALCFFFPLLDAQNTRQVVPSITPNTRLLLIRLLALPLKPSPALAVPTRVLDCVCSFMQLASRCSH
jgi:hypothetical protein